MWVFQKCLCRLSVGLQSIIKRWVSCDPTLLREAGLRGEPSCPRLHGWWQNWAVANGLAPAAFQNPLCKVAKTETASPALDADQTTQGDQQVLERRRKTKAPAGPPGCSQEGGGDVTLFHGCRRIKHSQKPQQPSLLLHSPPKTVSLSRPRGGQSAPVGGAAPNWAAMATCGC